MNVHPLAELFPMMEGDALEALADDIGKHGQREGIVLLDGAILDGRNRYRACAMAGVPPRFRDFDGDDPLAFVLSLNLTRRHLNESQRAMVAARLARLKDGQRQVGQLAQVPTQAEAAQLLNVGERSVKRAAVVRDQGSPEIRRAVDQGHLAVSAAAQAATLPADQQRRIAERAEAGDANAARNILKKEARAARETELAAAQKALPTKRFGVIYMDPEWRFEPWSRETGLDRAADNHYPTSDLAAIMARDVASIATDDCVMFEWSPANRVADAIKVMENYGFAYVTMIVWGKDRAGTGYWVRDKHEVLLIGKRGKIPAPAPGTQCESLIPAPVGKHSAKPEIFAEIIERYFPHLPKIELNRRGPPRPGWAAWGNEAGAEEAPPTAAPPAGAGNEPTWWAEARRMRAAGARIFDIAAQFGKSPSTVHEALGKSGKRERAAGPDTLEIFCANSGVDHSEPPRKTGS
ncbi:MAG TPA: MT-A70 family methyltransferase [Roseiarcus sp.]|jgi:N6-adenosine-specific RNA methylase IME4